MERHTKRVDAGWDLHVMTLLQILQRLQVAVKLTECHHFEDLFFCFREQAYRLELPVWYVMQSSPCRAHHVA